MNHFTMPLVALLLFSAKCMNDKSRVATSNTALTNQNGKFVKSRKLNRHLANVLVDYVKTTPPNTNLTLCLEVIAIKCDTTYSVLYSTYNDNGCFFQKFDIHSVFKNHKVIIKSGDDNILSEDEKSSCIDSDSIRYPLYNPATWLIASAKDSSIVKKRNFIIERCNVIKLKFINK